MQCRDCRLDADKGLIRINADREIIQSYFNDVVTDLFGVVPVIGQRLIICDENVDFVKFSGILQFNPAHQ